jgi:hypothetical protein
MEMGRLRPWWEQKRVLSMEFGWVKIQSERASTGVSGVRWLGDLIVGSLVRRQGSGSSPVDGSWID